MPNMSLAMVALGAAISSAACMTGAERVADSGATAAPTCIPLSRIAGRGPDAGAVRIEMTDGTVYRSVPDGACPALERARPSDVLSFDSRNGQICAGDRFRIADPAEGSGPHCRLGRFVRSGS